MAENRLSTTRQRGPMDRGKILAMLTDLGAELDAQGLSTDIQVVGGAAMALTFSQMRVTEDVDAVVANRGAEFERAAATVAQRHGVADDWISDDISDFVSSSPEGDQTLIALPGVNVYVASAEHLLAMKVRAATTRMTPRDRGDLVVLADHLGLGDAHEVADLTERQFSGIYRDSIGRDEYVATVTEAFLQDDIEKGRDPMVRWEASQAREAEQRSSSGQDSEYDFDF